MSADELIQALRQRVDQLTEEQLEDLKQYFIQVHAVRNRSETALATDSIVNGMEHIFSQLDPVTVALLKQRIQEQEGQP